MPVDERARHLLFRKLEAVLGSEEAGTLMDHLPPAALANLATKDDILGLRNEFLGRLDSQDRRLTGRIERLDQRLTGRMDRLEEGLIGRMDSLEERMTSRMESLEHRLTAKIEQSARRLVMWTSSMVLAATALAFAAGRFV